MGLLPTVTLATLTEYADAKFNPGGVVDYVDGALARENPELRGVIQELINTRALSAEAKRASVGAVSTVLWTLYRQAEKDVRAARPFPVETAFPYIPPDVILAAGLCPVIGDAELRGKFVAELQRDSPGIMTFVDAFIGHSLECLESGQQTVSECLYFGMVAFLHILAHGYSDAKRGGVT